MMHEFDCPDCGQHILLFGYSRALPPSRCALCTEISGIVDDATRAKVRTLLLRDPAPVVACFDPVKSDTEHIGT